MTDEIVENLKRAIIRYDAKEAEIWAKKVVQEKLDPLRAAKAITETIRQIGEHYGQGELFLPELVGAAEAMQRAMPIIEEEIKKRGEKRETLGRIILGTVYGDIHSIGKNMVAALLVAAGFEVKDLGVNVPPEKFVAAVQDYQPDILGMSALLSTTAPEQQRVIRILKEKSLRDKVRIMVGGAAITEKFAQDIGADAYEATAPGAVELAGKLISD